MRTKLQVFSKIIMRVPEVIPLDGKSEVAAPERDIRGGASSQLTSSKKMRLGTTGVPLVGGLREGKPMRAVTSADSRTEPTTTAMVATLRRAVLNSEDERQ